jgi:hypothetical protein
MAPSTGRNRRRHGGSDASIPGVSFDDGASWRRVPVVAGTAIVAHPAGAGFAALRASATDTAGNTVEQTIIRAYRFG